MTGKAAARSAWGGLAIVLLAGLSCAATAQTRSWPAAGIASHPAEYVRLIDARGNAVATVPRDLMQQILQVQDRLQQTAGFAGELYITEGRGPNAFAINARGRSMIGITAPMLDLLGNDLDAYAALLGHEIAHHARQHAVERRSREQSLAGAGAIAGLLLGAAGVRHGAAIAHLGRSAVSSAYSRDDEREADRLGVQWMIAAGFDPEGALRLHERLLQRGRGGAIPFLQSHPAGAERVQNIRHTIASLAPSTMSAADEIRGLAVQPQHESPGTETDADGSRAFHRGIVAYWEKDYATARRELLRAAAAGNPDAQYGLGLLNAAGLGPSAPDDQAGFSY